MQLQGDDIGTHLCLGQNYLQKGMYEHAISEFETVTRLAPRFNFLGYAYAAAGRREDALRVLKEQRKMSDQMYVPRFYTVCTYLGLGEKQKALDLLEQAYEERSSRLLSINVEPLLDPLRSEPRFQKLIRRMNFPE